MFGRAMCHRARFGVKYSIAGWWEQGRCAVDNMLRPAITYNEVVIDFLKNNCCQKFYFYSARELMVFMRIILWPDIKYYSARW
ncbi:MAG: hypothetical protein ACRC0C_01865 [Gibbsiella quercinecans]|uniref:hypothetical protein n=1 Tax=Gibbsiella quercinecans TaxID=929813 RepID=UPI003F3E446C